MGDQGGADSDRTQAACDYWVLGKRVLAAITLVCGACALGKDEGIKAPRGSE